ncbi:hypothetical protein, partial [Lactiplantibacillus argentoratensis]|uniref:hypothetical protein n=1 Tax=Lactiplantibacillus argentoratensis TaxID=271881 RepID=UPI001E45B87F
DCFGPFFIFVRINYRICLILDKSSAPKKWFFGKYHFKGSWFFCLNSVRINFTIYHLKTIMSYGRFLKT